MSDKWGLVATVLAPANEILHFAAYHLEAGAHRLYIYLDAPDPVAFKALRDHPKIRVKTCDDGWWSRHNGRPQKHQVRQAINATHAYGRKAEVDWLIHMDVDEFLVTDKRVGEVLAALPNDTRAARIRPMEALSGEGDAFKAFIPPGKGRQDIVRALYPTYGEHLNGGFLSHQAGKVFIRTGIENVRWRIHNGFEDGEEITGADMAQDVIALAHCHAKTWEQWLCAYRFRHERGSYRAELRPNRARDKGGLTMHELFAMIEQSDGEAGLRAFFDEVCADAPELRARLGAHGLLRHADLRLSAPLERHFPAVTL